MLKVTLEPGDKVAIAIEGSDGMFTVEYGATNVTVEADMPDSTGREGVIYDESWSDSNDERGKEIETEHGELKQEPESDPYYTTSCSNCNFKTCGNLDFTIYEICKHLVSSKHVGFKVELQ